MNFHSITIVSGCIGVLTVFLMCVFTKYQFHLFTSKMSNQYLKDIRPVIDLSDTENISSSIWCNKRFDGSKLCKFKNLYYFPEFKDNFLFLMTEFSVVSGVEDLKKLSLSTVQNHSFVFMKIIIIKSSAYFLNKNISVLEKNAFLMRSFKSDNIMHVLHDDLLPLFVTYKELCNGDIYLCVSSYHLILIDNNIHRPYFQWYMHFSALKPIIITIEEYPLCIRKGYFGLSNSSIWFQYGFKNNQGPLINHYINNVFLMEFSDYIKQQFGVFEASTSKHMKNIVFFSRKINRRLVNDKEMEENMINMAQNVFKENITLETFDISTNSSNIIIQSLQKSQLLVGIHGSAMILALFMPPGSHIVELFPFGIQPEFVSPIRALCKLQNIYYNYESWVNINESNTRTHPEYPPLLGGIFHLEDSEQNRIKNIKKVPAVECCHEPVYLFRMYQDTIVDDSFYKLFHKVVSTFNGSHMTKDGVMLQHLEQNLMKWYFPPPVFNISCQYYNDKFKVSWDYPFPSQGIQFSIATSNGLLGVTKQTNFLIKAKETYSEEVISTPEQTVTVWVKAIDGDKDSLDSFVRCITILSLT